MKAPKPFDDGAAQAQVERILRSKGFMEAQQLKDLLGFLFVKRDSQDDLAPETVLNLLWPDGNGSKGDLNTAMGRLRAALQNYYKNEGSGDGIRIEVPATPKGGYRRAWIEVVSQDPGMVAEPAAPVQPPKSQEAEPSTKASRPFRQIFIGVAVSIVGMITVLLAFNGFTEIRITPPLPGAVRCDSLIQIEGRGGKPWLIHYLIVEWEPLTGPHERYVQQGGPLIADFFLRWRRGAFLGNDKTEKGTTFAIYILSVPAVEALKPGRDFEQLSGKLTIPLPFAEPGHSIRVTCSL